MYVASVPRRPPPSLQACRHVIPHERRHGGSGRFIVGENVCSTRRAAKSAQYQNAQSILSRGEHNNQVQDLQRFMAAHHQCAMDSPDRVKLYRVPLQPHCPRKLLQSHSCRLSFVVCIVVGSLSVRLGFDISSPRDGYPHFSQSRSLFAIYVRVSFRVCLSKYFLPGSTEEIVATLFCCRLTADDNNTCKDRVRHESVFKYPAYTKLSRIAKNSSDRMKLDRK